LPYERVGVSSCSIELTDGIPNDRLIQLGETLQMIIGNAGRSVTAARREEQT
jgi:hypothetical protein